MLVFNESIPIFNSYKLKIIVKIADVSVVIVVSDFFVLI